MPTAAEVFREFNVDGQSSSGQYQPEKTEIIEWGEGLETQLTDLEEKDVEHQELIDAMVQTVIEAQYPVGSLLFTSNSSVPAAYLENDREWERYAEGRAVVGVGNADGITYSGGTTRGTNSVALSENQLPSHDHGNGSLSVSGNTGNGGNDWGFHIKREDDGTDIIISPSSGLSFGGNAGSQARLARAAGGSTQRVTHNATHNHSFSANVGGSTANAGGGAAHTNIQPSIGVYVFKRIA